MRLPSEHFGQWSPCCAAVSTEERLALDLLYDSRKTA
jgi:hypothetical protein